MLFTVSYVTVVYMYVCTRHIRPLVETSMISQVASSFSDFGIKFYSCIIPPMCAMCISLPSVRVTGSVRSVFIEQSDEETGTRY
jgi:hypothetical protein